MKRVAVGMSGGVDSSVATYLLKQQGYDVTGVFIEAYNEPGCRTDQDRKDALAVATRLDIRFQILDFRKEYREKVVNYFFETYKRGATPNPDVVCNREVKFGLFYEWAMNNGFDYVATGHYARIAQVPRTSSSTIQRPTDLSKDQSYFLWQVDPRHLAHILFPLGEIKKQEVRKIAQSLGLPNADKPDSMGVCMMGELNVRDFLKHHLGENAGNVVMSGHIVGTHNGLWFHTVGQRGGFYIDKKLLKSLGYHPEEMEPLYVIGKNVEKNLLIVGDKEKAMRDTFMIHDSRSMINEEIMRELVVQGRLFVRIRNLGELNDIESIKASKGKMIIAAKERIFGVAEGQAAVLYARMGDVGSEIVVAGGEIAV